MTDYSWLRRMFSSYDRQNCYDTEAVGDIEKKQLYMIIPLDKDNIEIPAFAMAKFSDLLEKGGVKHLPSAIVVVLKSEGHHTYYKSFDKVIKTTLQESFKSKLIKLKGKDGDREITYFGTLGALFDKNFKPLMMCTWTLEKKVVNPYDPKEKIEKMFFQRPILRIDPEFYLSKPDNVGRFVNKKMVGGIFDQNICIPVTDYDNRGFGQPWLSKLPKIEIDKIPFEVTSTNRPSISTTNSILLQTVLDNMEDFQWA